MLPLLIVLGATGAVLEVKRLMNRAPKDGDLFRLQQSEDKLKRVLQDVQRELHQEKNEHQRDQARVEELERVAQELRAAQAELDRKSRELEQKAIGLSAENEDLLKKVGDLQLHHEAELRIEAEKFEAELETLKQEVAHAFEAFSDGTLSAEGLLGTLFDLGVEVELTADELRALPEAGNDEQCKKVQQVELQVDSNWRSHLRLLSDDPERMARQLAESAHRAALPAPGIAGAAHFPSVKTPPKDRREGSIFGGVPAIAMSVFTPRPSAEKENLVEAPKAASCEVADGKERLQTRSQAANPPNSPIASAKTTFQNRKAPTPTRKKPPPVPRLGLSVVLRGDQQVRPANRDAFAMSELSIDDDEHKMLRGTVIRG